MNEYNVYGKSEINLVLVHGGPGARGSLKDLALMLSRDLGILEINQSKLSIKELIEEMDDYITKTCKNKVTLLGHSWGAWLVCLYAHKYPDRVSQLILVGSGSFDKRYVKEFNERRLGRLSKDDKNKYDLLMKEFTSNDLSNKDEIMAEFGKLMGKLDIYEYKDNEYSADEEANFQMFNSIWNEASSLRETGELMKIMKEIDVPIHVVQGDYDSHDIKGVVEPFEENGIEFTYDVIKKCGHYPWREKYGEKQFIEIIKKLS